MENSTLRATGVACANIAFIKYWGNHDAQLRLPLNDSLSMNLAALTTTTTVEFDPARDQDQVSLNGAPADEQAKARVSKHLDLIRARANVMHKAIVASKNNFPAASGIASSASAFAALTVAATHALGLEMNERELSILARQGSGSAARSIPAGFVQWLASRDTTHSFAQTIVPPDYWELRDVIAVVSDQPKQVPSTEGHFRAVSSPFLGERLNRLPARFHHTLRAIRQRELAALGPDLEAEALELHAIAMTSKPPILYLMPETVRVLQSVWEWRREGLQVYFTLDAGANVHLICAQEVADEIEKRTHALQDVKQVLVSGPGGGAHVVEEPVF